MMRKKMLPIDKVKTINALAECGMTQEEAGKVLGMSKCYFYSVFRRGTISESGMVLMNKVLGIKYQDIKPQKPEAEAEKPPVPDITLKLVEEAVFRAIVRYGIEEKIYNGMRRALND